jgi:hypothetical protein
VGLAEGVVGDEGEDALQVAIGRRVEDERAPAVPILEGAECVEGEVEIALRGVELGDRRGRGADARLLS